MSTAVSQNLEATTQQALAAAAGTTQAGTTPQPMPELNGLLLQLPGAPQIYLVLNGFRCWVPDPATFNNLFVSGATIIQDINIGVVSQGPAAFERSGAGTGIRLASGLSREQRRQVLDSHSSNL